MRANRRKRYTPETKIYFSVFIKFTQLFKESGFNEDLLKGDKSELRDVYDKLEKFMGRHPVVCI